MSGRVVMTRCGWMAESTRCPQQATGAAYWSANTIRLCDEHLPKALGLALEVPSRLRSLPPDPDHGSDYLVAEIPSTWT